MSSLKARLQHKEECIVRLNTAIRALREEQSVMEKKHNAELTTAQEALHNLQKQTLERSANTCR